jgi:hypothetical protein
MTPFVLRILIECSEKWRPALESSFDALCDIIGVGKVFVSDRADANVIYGVVPPDVDSGRIYLASHPFVGGGSDPAQIGQTTLDTLLYELVEQAPGPKFTDFLLLTWLCLSGAVEGACPRDPYGVPKFRTLPPSHARLIDEPIVNQAAAALEARLHAALGTGLRVLPRWPNNCRFAICVTHDVDEPLSHRRAKYFLRRLGRCAREGNFKLGVRSAVAAVNAGVAELVGMRPPTSADPNFGFFDWMAFEDSIGCRSTFYVATTTSAMAGSSFEDVAYDAHEPDFVFALKECATRGWEISLHASINARHAELAIADETRRLQALIEPMRVPGVRHHYWSLDCERPSDTWAKHRAAGLTYDSSLGMNDRVGFRRGIAWPFVPIEQLRDGAKSDLVQIPPTIMDGAVLISSPEGSRADFICDHLEDVASFGGLAVLDWHVEQANPKRLEGIGPDLREALHKVSGRSDVAWLCASDVEKWWRERRELLRRAALDLALVSH